MKRTFPAAVTASRILVFAVMLLLIATAIFLPRICDRYFEGHCTAHEAEMLYTPTLVLLYCALVPAFVAIFSLGALLREISRGQLFHGRNVLLLRALAVCCLAECAVFFTLGFCFMLSFILSFAALFMALMLWVVGELVRVGTSIKQENDYTI